MKEKPEDIKPWKVIEIASVQKKVAQVLGDKEETRILRDVYDRLKGKLTTYPPDQDYFSNPIEDTESHLFWVKSENGQIIVRAKYVMWAETCVIDKFYLASEKPTGLDL